MSRDIDQNAGALERLLQVVPVLAGLVFHAIALDRWALAIPAGIVIVAATTRNVWRDANSKHWYLAAGCGVLGGMLFAVNVIAGPLSPSAVSALTGAAIAIAALATFTGKIMIAWVAAWGLVALSGQLEVRGTLLLALIAFLATSMVAVVFSTGHWRSRFRAFLPICFFVVLVVLSTAGITVAVKRLDRAFLSTVETFIANNATSSTTGLSSTITLNSNSSIKLSQKPLLELSEMSGLLRTKVMDSFDGRQWTTSMELKTAWHMFDEVIDRSESPRSMEVIFLDDLGNALPAPAGTWQVKGSTAQVVGGWVLRGESNVARLSLIGNRKERLPSEPQPGERELAVPEPLRDELGQVAEELTANSATNVEKAESIARFFQNSFDYSLVTDLQGDAHPLVLLVKQRRPAYCVYFASAMAVMLRTQGVPARIVSGFAPTEMNRLTGRVTIRERDSHAWVEFWSPEQERYISIDPTPSSSRLQATGQADPQSLLVSFAGAIRSTIRRVTIPIRHDPSSVAARLTKSALVGIPLLVLLVIYVRRRRSTTSSKKLDAVDLVDPALREIYDRYLLSLKKFGITPRPWETDEELINRLSDVGDVALAKAASRFISDYRDARFGGVVVDQYLAELAKLSS